MSRVTARRVLAAVAVVASFSAAAIGLSAASAGASSATESPAISITRLAGADRYATAVAVASAPIPSPVGSSSTPPPAPPSSASPVVFIATGMDFPDALAAAPIAAKLDGTLLLTPPDYLPGEVATELESLKPTTVAIMGGPSVVSDAVRATIASDVPTATIVRLSGPDRYATALDAVHWAMQVSSTPFSSTAYLATGGGFADALSAAAAAGAQNAPVLLVPPGATALDAATTSILTALGTTSVTLVGGPSVISGTLQTALSHQFANVARLSGADRYATALAIAQSMKPTGNAYLATGANFPDALAGAVAAGRAGSPLLTVPSTCVPPATLTYLHTTTSAMYELGSPGALSTNIDTLVPCANATYAASISRVMAVDTGAPSANRRSMLNDISCVNANWCVAVGNELGRPVIATLSSGRWTSVDAPLPSNAAISTSSVTDLSAVSCSSTTECVAAGTYAVQGGGQLGLIETLSGGWSAKAVTPTQAGSALALKSAACNGGRCTVAGISGGNQAVALTYAGGQWSAPAFMSGSTQHSSLTCPTSSWCALLADDTGSNAPIMNLDASTDTWSPAAVSTTSGVGGTMIDSITCTGVDECSGIGQLDGYVPAVVKSTPSNPWHQEDAAYSLNNGGPVQSTSISKISCATPDLCLAAVQEVVPTQSVAEGQVELMLMGNQTSSLAAIDLPSDARGHGALAFPAVSALECPASGLCIVTGTYITDNFGQEAFISTLSGGVWATHRVPYPSDEFTPGDFELAGVSCPTASICRVAGYQNYNLLRLGVAQWSSLVGTVSY